MEPLGAEHGVLTKGGEAIVSRARERSLDLPVPTAFEAIAGHGVQAVSSTDARCCWTTDD